MREILQLFSVCLLIGSISCGYLYDRWGNVNDDNGVNSVFERPRPVPAGPRGSTSNLGCFLCTQLLSVTKHRVGLSQNQLRNVLYEKCRVLPQEQCFTFVDRSLPEIYFSLNYDFSSKNVCVTLNLCDETNPFAVASPPPTPPPPPPPSTVISHSSTTQPSPPTPPPEEISRRPEPEPETETVPRGTPITMTDPPPSIRPSAPVQNIRQSPPSPPVQPSNPYEQTNGDRNRVRERENLGGTNIKDRIGHKNENREQLEQKRMTCKFCERMLENAKQYAVTAKSDITSFANNACAQMTKGRPQDQCYELADKKIDELAKFVDHQVIEALWCAELNRC